MQSRASLTKKRFQKNYHNWQKRVSWFFPQIFASKIDTDKQKEKLNKLSLVEIIALEVNYIFLFYIYTYFFMKWKNTPPLLLTVIASLCLLYLCYKISSDYKKASKESKDIEAKKKQPPKYF